MSGPGKQPMFRRAPTIFATAFLALAFLLGIPAAGGGLGEPVAMAGNATAGNTTVIATGASIRGTLNQQSPDGGVNQRSDEDDDRVIRISFAVPSPHPLTCASWGLAADVVGPTHRPCAFPPRAPPAA
jgi:hypothetical protein